MATSGEYAAMVRRLGCLRGVSTLTAFGLAVEVGDWHRLIGATRRLPPLGVGIVTHRMAGGQRFAVENGRPGCLLYPDTWM